MSKQLISDLEVVMTNIAEGNSDQAFFDLWTVRGRVLSGAYTNGGTPDRLKAREVTCPTCFAKPGGACFEMTNRGKSAKPTAKLRTTGYHSTRYALVRSVP